MSADKLERPLDLFLLPIHIDTGQEQTDLPGLAAAATARRVERTRSGDLLVALFIQTAGPTLTNASLNELLTSALGAFYRTRGPVTTALQAGAEQLNEALLKYNQRSASETRHTQGSLCLAVLRRESLVLGISGSARAIVLARGEVQEITDFEPSAHGVGIGRRLNLRFFQTQVQPGDLLVLAREIPESFASDLRAGNLARPSLEPLRRRLISQGGEDIYAAVIQFQAGTGQLRRLKPRSAAAQTAPDTVGQPPQAPTPAKPSGPLPSAGIYITGERLPSAAAPQSAAPSAAAEASAPPASTATTGLSAPASAIPVGRRPRVDSSRLPADGAAENPPVPEKPAHSPSADSSGHSAVDHAGQFVRSLFSRRAKAAAAPDATTPAAPALDTTGRSPLSDRYGYSVPDRAVAQPLRDNAGHSAAPSAGTAGHSAAPPSAKTAVPSAPVWRKHVARAWFAGDTAREKVGGGFGKLLVRMLPGSADSPAAISPGSMLFIAIAIPLVVVAIAVTVYFYAPSGRSQLRAGYLKAAQTYADQAILLKDRTLKRNTWQQVMYYLDLSEKYGQTPATTTLRQHAQLALDQMDGIQRLEYQTIIPTGFASTAKFTRIVSNQTDVYLLDSSRGRILRLYQVGQNYEVDSNFSCGPGPSGATTITNLIDMAVLPVNDKGATVAGIDNQGNVLYCIPGQEPLSRALAPPPNNWGAINGIAVDQGVLYLLDKKNNAVWMYGGPDVSFSVGPRLFFDNQIPALIDVIDMTVNGEDLYLLHSTGTMTTCTYRSAAGVTKCTEPAKYGDSHNGGKSEQLVNFAGTQFDSVLTTQPPDPSLYMLDAKSNTVYHFSLRLNLQHLYRPQTGNDYPELQKPASAFYISDARIVYMAVGNVVFYAALP